MKNNILIRLSSKLLVVLVTAVIVTAQGPGKQQDRPGKFELRRGFTSNAVSELEDFAGETFPNDLKTTLTNDGDMSDLIDWLEEEEILPREGIVFWEYRQRLHYEAVRSYEIDKLEAWFHMQRDLLELDTIFGTYIPSDVRVAFVDGDLSELEEWVTGNGIRVEKSQWGAVRRILNKSGASAGLISRMESSLTGTGSITTSGEVGAGGSGSATWGSLTVTSDVVESMKRKLQLKIPAHVALSMNGGNFMEFSTWLKSKGRKISSRRWKRLMGHLKGKRVSEATMEGLQSWYSETGGKGGAGVGVGVGVGGNVEWKSLKLTTNQISKLGSAIGKNIPLKIRTKIKAGKFEAFSNWLADNKVTLDTSTFQSLIGDLRAAGANSGTLEALQAWHVDFQGTAESSVEGNSKAGGSGSVEVEWQSIKLTNIQISKLRSSLGKSIPSKIRKKLKSGDFEAFSDWLTDNNISVGDNEFETLIRELRATGATTGTLEALQAWHVDFAGSAESSAEGNSNVGVGGSVEVEWQSIKLTNRQIFKLRSSIGKSIPYKIRKKIRSGDFEAFSDWLTDNNISLGDNAFQTLIGKLRATGASIGTLEALQAWHVEFEASAESSYEGGTEGNANVDWKSLKLTTSQIYKFRYAIGRSIPNKIQRQLKAGNFEAFSEWLTDRKITMDANAFQNLIKDLRASGASSVMLEALQAWHVEFEGSVESSKSKENSKSNKNSAEKSKKKSGSNEKLKGSKSKKKSGSNEKVKGSKSKKKSGSNEKPKGSEEVGKLKVKLKRKNVKSIEKIIGKKIPNKIRRKLIKSKGAKLGVLIDWLKSKKISLSGEQALQIVNELESQGVAAETLGAFAEWQQSISSKAGVSGSVGGRWADIKLSRSQISVLGRFLGSNTLPQQVSQRLMSGDFGSFSAWMKEQRLSISQYDFTRMKAELTNRGVSRNNIQKLETWFAETGGNGGVGLTGTGSGAGKLTGAGEVGVTGNVDWSGITLTAPQISALAKTLGIARTRIPRAVRKKIRAGDFKAFSVWMQQNGLELSSDQFSDLTVTLRRKGVSANNLNGLEAWFAQTGGKGGVDVNVSGGISAEIGKKARSEGTSVEVSGSAAWKSIRLNTRQISVLEHSLTQDIPADIRASLGAGDFLAFSEWMASNGLEIKNVNALGLKLKLVGLSTGKVKNLLSWHAATNGRGGSGSGTSGVTGTGGTGTTSGNSLSINSRGIAELENIFLPRGPRIPSQIQARLSSGALGSFFGWLREEGIQVSESQLGRLKASASRVGISSEAVEMFATFEGSQRSVSQRGIRGLNEITKISMPRAQTRALKNGDYEPFFSWLQTRRIEFASSDWNYFKNNYESWGISGQFFELMSAFHKPGGSTGGGGNGGRTAEQTRLAIFQGNFLGGKMPPARVYQVSETTGTVTIDNYEDFIRWMNYENLSVSAENWLLFEQEWDNLWITREGFVAFRSWFWQYNLNYPPWVIGMLEWAENEGKVSEEKIDQLTIPWENGKSLDKIFAFLKLTVTPHKLGDFMRGRGSG